jgi:hypothetical protein
MNKRLTKEEIQKINELWDQGMYQKDIGALFGRCQGTICNVVNRPERKRRKIELSPPVEKTFPMIPQNEDLSSLPDNAIFRHMNYAIP